MENFTLLQGGLVAIAVAGAFWLGRSMGMRYQRNLQAMEPWRWSRQSPRRRPFGAPLSSTDWGDPPPMPGMAPVIKALDEAAISLSRYLVSPGDAKAAMQAARTWMSAAEEHLQSVPKGLRPPPPPPPPRQPGY